MKNKVQFNPHLWVFARSMIISGYATKIIEIETLLSYKQIQKIKSNLHAEGVAYPNRTNKIKSTGGIINTHAKRIHTALFSQIYTRYIGNTTDCDVNIHVLDCAYETYIAILSDLPDKENEIWTPLTKTEVWCVMQEMRRGDAKIKWCNACHASYYVAKDQLTKAQCPFCHPLRESVVVRND